MAKFMTLYNNKGGCGKSTITINLADVLAKRGYKVLLIDTDTQCNSSSFYADMKKFKRTFADVLRGEELISNCIVSTERGVDVVTFGREMFPNTADIKEQQTILIQAWNWLDEQYDFVLVDTPPAINNTNRAIFSLSDGIIVPVMASRFDLEGFITLFDEVRNYGGKVFEVVFSKIKKRNNTEKKICDIIKNGNFAKISKGVIYDNNSIENCTSNGKTLSEYYKKGCEPFEILADEIIKYKA